MIGHGASAARIVGVSRLGGSTAHRLTAGPRVIGRVHSVFERAVNLLGADGRLVTLHGPGPLAAPFAVALDEGLARLAADLDEGRWDARFGHLRAQDNADLGYRLLVAEPTR